MAAFPGVQTIPYNDDYSLMIYQTDKATNNTYKVASDIYSPNGVIDSLDTYNGQFNTELIIDFSGFTNTVAKLCDNYSITVSTILLNDWYLPSTEELTAIYNAGYIVGSGYLWTSTEVDSTNAKRLDIATGVISNTTKSTTYQAIPVRKVYLNDYVTIERMNLQSIQADILRGGENNADEDVYKMLGGVNGISKNSNILSNE